MEVVISGRHFTVTSEMKEYIEAKIRDMVEGRPLKVSSVRVVLELEKTRHKAEVIINIKHHVIEADVETYDMYESVDKALAKAETQVRRYLDKVQDHHPHGVKPAPEPVDSGGDGEYDEDV